LWPYAALATALWMAVYLSGIHATVAGVLAAAAVPAQRAGPRPQAAGSPLDRMEHALQPWVAFGVLPLFAFANAGVSLQGISTANLFSPLAIALVASLFVGKQLGVFVSIRIAVALGLGKLPRGATWPQVYGLAVLSGIGFTISLFIGDLAFDDPVRNDQVKIGVLAGSCLSALVGYCVLRFARSRAR
jgi:NhaA family Na+:H+ antiporter